MADEHRYSSSAGRDRGGRVPRPASSTHSSYEEAIRRSNERLSNVQRRAQRLSEVQRDSFADNSGGYVPRSLRQSPDYQRQREPLSTQRTRRTPQRERRTIRLYGDEPPAVQAQEAQRAQQQPYGQQRTRQRQQMTGAGQQDRQRGLHLPVNLPANLPNPFSRGQQGNLRDQQFQGHSRNAGGYQAQRPSLPFIGGQGRGTGFNGVVIRAVICLVLLIIVVFSITRIGPAAATLNEAQQNVAAHQEELDSQNKANEDLQAQIDQMQQTVEKYNELKAASS